MTESLLLFVVREWKKCLQPLPWHTTCGRRILAFDPGRFNPDGGGPDFSNARILFEDQDLESCGNLEVDLKTNGWVDHGHQENPAYKEVVLRVVWQADTGFQDEGPSILALEKLLLQPVSNLFEELNKSKAIIPCARLCGMAPKTGIEGVTATLLEEKGLERIREKLQADFGREDLPDWSQILWERTAAIFGGPANQDAFRAIARALPFSFVQRLADSSLTLSALLLGMAGMLEPFMIDNPEATTPPETKSEMTTKILPPEEAELLSIIRTWIILKEKYELMPLNCHFEYRKVRPAAWPDFRLGLLAAFVATFPTLRPDLQKRPKIRAGLMWEKYLQPTKGVPAPTSFRATLSAELWNLWQVNAFLPLLWAWHQSRNQAEQAAEVVNMLKKVKPENNKFVVKGRAVGWRITNILQSQGVKHVLTNFCSQKRCLCCSLGKYLIFHQTDS